MTDDPPPGFAEVDRPVCLPDGTTIYPTDVRELVLDRKAGTNAQGAYSSAVVSLRMKRGKGRKIEVPPDQDPTAFLHCLDRILTRAER